MSNLRTYRESKGLLQQDVAFKLGIPLDEYQRCEAYPEDMTLEQAKLVCKVLGIPLDFIFAPKR